MTNNLQSLPRQLLTDAWQQKSLLTGIFVKRLFVCYNYHIIHGFGDNYIVPHNRVNYNMFSKNLYLNEEFHNLCGYKTI